MRALLASCFAGAAILLSAAVHADPQTARPSTIPLSARVQRFDGGPAAPIGNERTLQQALFELHAQDSATPDGIPFTEAALSQVGPEVIPLAVVSFSAPLSLFMAAALRADTYRGGDLVFTLDRQHWIGDPPPAWIGLDLDDGLGFRTLTIGVPLAMSYSTIGNKTLVLRAGDSPAHYREVRFDLRVHALGTPTPDDTLRVAGGVPYRGGIARGLGYVYLAAGHTRLVHPVVVVEGFDLANDQHWDELYRLLDRQDLIERVRARGDDIVVVDFADATDYLQRNAFVLVALLQQIQARIAPEQSLTVFGASTGGVIARYALAWMETHGVPHRVSSFISMDSPYLGANVPLGIQYWFRFFAGIASQAKFFVERLARPASRQILLIQPSFGPARQDTLRTALLAELHALGDWPRQPRKVAIANGSSRGLDQGFGPSAPLLTYHYDAFLRHYRGDVWALPDGGPATIFHGSITTLLPLATETITASGTRPIDGAPGGWRATMLQMDMTAVPFGDIVAIHPHHCFVPTASAIALDGADFMAPLPSAAELRSRTPFDTVYVPADNQDHVSVTAENAGWIESEVIRATTSAAPIAARAATPLEAAAIGPVIPNPFRDGTRIAFRAPSGGPVRLTVLDLSGRRVATLIEGALAPGAHQVTWDGRNQRGERAPAGIYFVRLELEGRASTSRITRLE